MANYEIKEKKIPDRVYIKKEDRAKYDAIKSSNGDLKGISNIDLYIISMFIGYYYVRKPDYKNKKSEAFALVNSFKDNTLNFMEALAIKEKEDMDVLLDMKEIFDIADAYASAGIDKFEKFYFENEYTFIKRMEGKLLEALKDQALK